MRRLVVLSMMIVAASGAGAVTLDLDNPNGIAALYVVSQTGGVESSMFYVVCTNGSGYRVTYSHLAQWEPCSPSPVPLAEVVDWTPWVLYTTSGAWWGRSNTAGAAWEQMGVAASPPPPRPALLRRSARLGTPWEM